MFDSNKHLKASKAFVLPIRRTLNIYNPKENRTLILSLKGTCPKPLDDGVMASCTGFEPATYSVTGNRSRPTELTAHKPNQGHAPCSIDYKSTVILYIRIRHKQVERIELSHSGLKPAILPLNHYRIKGLGLCIKNNILKYIKFISFLKLFYDSIKNK